MRGGSEFKVSGKMQRQSIKGLRVHFSGSREEGYDMILFTPGAASRIIKLARGSGSLI